MLARDVHDPEVGFVTVTRVEVTPDLQLARVFYTSIGSDADRRKTARALGRATPFLRGEVGRRLGLRRVPVLEFRFDKSVEHQERVEQLLREIHEQERERSGGPEEPAGQRQPNDDGDREQD
ncbi:MAG: rbfA [Acidobacteria bacterium]|nr:rbfA [Acidobacteriota bacterium]